MTPSLKAAGRSGEPLGLTIVHSKPEHFGISPLENTRCRAGVYFGGQRNAATPDPQNNRHFNT